MKKKIFVFLFLLFLFLIFLFLYNYNENINNENYIQLENIECSENRPCPYTGQVCNCETGKCVNLNFISQIS